MAGSNPQMVIRIAANIDELRRNLAEGKASIEALGPSVAKMASTWKEHSNKLIQDAHNITAALKEIGGGTRLTAADAAKNLKVLDQAMAQLTATAREVPAGMREAADSLRGVGAAATTAATASAPVASMTSTFSALGVAAGTFIGNMATRAVAALTAEIGTLVSRGAQLSVVKASFENLALGANASSERMLKAMRSGSKGMVADIDLMLAANKSLLLGLPVTEASMGELAKTASVLGRAMGQDSTKSIDDLITALGRSSPMILDNLGLSVKVGEANEIYAAKVNKVADALTDGEKKLAFYEEALRKARIKTEQIGEQTKTASDLMATAWASITNVVTSSVSAINVALGTAFNSIGHMLDRASHLDVVGLALSFKGLGNELAQVKAKGDGVLDSLAAPVKPAFDFAGPIKPAIIALEEFDRANKKNDEAVQKSIETYDKHNEALRDVANALTPIAEAERKQILARLESVTVAGRLVVSEATVAAAYGFSEEHVRAVSAAEKERADKAKNNADAIKSALEKADDAARGLQQKTDAATMAAMEKTTKAQMDNIARAISAARKASDTYLQLISTKSERAITAARVEYDAAMKSIEPIKTAWPEAYATASKQIKFAYDVVAEASDDTTQQVIADNEKAKKSFDDFMDALTQLATIAGGTFGGLVKQTSSALASVNALKKGYDALKSAAMSAGQMALAGFLFIGSAWKNMQDETKRQQAEAAAAWDQWLKEAAEREKQYHADALAAMDKYKIAWKDLGDAARSAMIDGAVKSILDDFNMLLSVGASSAGAIRGMSGAINELLGKIGESGGTITPALMPIVEQMMNLGLVSEDAMRKLMGLTQTPAPVDWKAMEAAAKKYGIALDQMGKGFQQAKLNDTFATLAADFKLLVDGGANMNAVIAGIGPKINEAVLEARKYGASIPASMKPAIEAMIKAGELFDENGNKLTDLGALNFAVPIEDSMKELVKLFKEFIEQIKLSSAFIDKIPKNVNVDVDVNVRKTVTTTSTSAGSGANEEESGAEAARGGYVTSSGVQYLAAGGLTRDMGRLLAFRPNGTDTVPAMLTPGEGIVSRAGMQSLGREGLRDLNSGGGASDSGGGSMTVQLVIPDGRVLADVVVPWIPGAVKRYGLR